MKIIKEGKTKIKTKECEKCKCVFEYNNKDLQIVTRMLKEASPWIIEEKIFLVCPWCESVVIIENKEQRIEVEE